MIVGNEKECKELVVTEGRDVGWWWGQFKFYPELNRNSMQLIE